MPTDWGNYNNWNDLSNFGIKNSKNNVFDFLDRGTVGLFDPAGQTINGLRGTQQDYINAAQGLIQMGTPMGRDAIVNHLRSNNLFHAGDQANTLMHYLQLKGYSPSAIASAFAHSQQQALSGANDVASYYATPKGQMESAQAASAGHAMLANDPVFQLLLGLKSGVPYSNRGGLTLGGVLQSGINAYMGGGFGGLGGGKGISTGALGGLGAGGAGGGAIGGIDWSGMGRGWG